MRQTDRDIKEMLIGSSAVILFGVALIKWPSLGVLLNQYFLSYLEAAWHLVRSIV